MPATMTDVWYIQQWRHEVDTALNEHRTNGTPIVFSDLTSKLVNYEAQYTKDHQKDSNRISQASSGAGDHEDSVSGGNGKQFDSTTGEPFQWKIQGIDITVLYGSVDKVLSAEFQNLPNVTKNWFTANPDAECPSRFLTSKPNSNTNSTNNKKKKSTWKVSFAEANDFSDADADSVSDNGTDDCSASSDDNSDAS